MRKGFIEFEGAPNRAGSTGHRRVTLNERGVMMMNLQTFKDLGSPAAVRLFYHETDPVIVVVPTEATRQNAFPVKAKAGQYKYRVVHTSPFCRNFRIKVDRTVLFNFIDIDDDGSMTLDMRNTTSVTRGRY